MKRLYSVILTIVCAICAALPVRAEMPVDIPLYFGGYKTLDGSTYSVVTATTLTEDSPGSSTVDPVDPNQAKAELTGSTLVVEENVEGNVDITIRNYDFGKTILYTRFDQSLTIQLSDTATYLITMRFEDMRTAYGKFNYPASLSRKEVKNGQLYIRRGSSIYALPGTKVK